MSSLQLADGGGAAAAAMYGGRLSSVFRSATGRQSLSEKQILELIQKIQKERGISPGDALKIAACFPIFNDTEKAKGPERGDTSSGSYSRAEILFSHMIQKFEEGSDKTLGELISTRTARWYTEPADKLVWIVALKPLLNFLMVLAAHTKHLSAKTGKALSFLRDEYRRFHDFTAKNAQRARAGHAGNDFDPRDDLVTSYIQLRQKEIGVYNKELPKALITYADYKNGHFKHAAKKTRRDPAGGGKSTRQDHERDVMEDGPEDTEQSYDFPDGDGFDDLDRDDGGFGDGFDGWELI